MRKSAQWTIFLLAASFLAGTLRSAAGMAAPNSHAVVKTAEAYMASQSASNAHTAFTTYHRHTDKDANISVRAVADNKANAAPALEAKDDAQNQPHTYITPNSHIHAQNQPLSATSADSNSGPTPTPQDAAVSANVIVHHHQSLEAHELVQRALVRSDPPEGSPLKGNAFSEQAIKESNNVRKLLRIDWDEDWHGSKVAQSVNKPKPRTSKGYEDCETLLADVPVGGTAWVGFGSAGVVEMLINWAHHVIELGMGRSMLIGAFDRTAVVELQRRGLPTYNLSGALPEAHFRHAPYLFHRMGFLKAELILKVIDTGRSVLVSDSDVVWKMSPLPHLQRLRTLGAAVAASTDCLDVASDEGRQPKTQYGGCGHKPGAQHGAIFNTGVLWFAPHEGARRLLKEWANETLYLNNEWSDDQGVFNRIITRRGFYPVRKVTDDGSVILVPSDSAISTNGVTSHSPSHDIPLAPFPATFICSGHLVWVQRGGNVSDCAAIHLTFTEYGDAGKRWRMLESGLWAPLKSAYYSEGMFITFDPPRAEEDPAPESNGEDVNHELGVRKPGNMLIGEALKRSVRLREQVALMGRQVHALRDALAVAIVLNRTLILPHFDCMCDRSELNEVIPSCIYPGAPNDMKLPFKCSTHFVLDIHKLQMMQAPTEFGMQPHKFGGLIAPSMRLRTNHFLFDSRTDPSIRNSVVRVNVGGSPSGGDATLGARSSAGQLIDPLAGLRDTRVLHLSSTLGIFSGFDKTRCNQAYMFNTMMAYFLYGGSWCCSSRDKEEGRALYANPPPFS